MTSLTVFWLRIWEAKYADKRIDGACIQRRNWLGHGAIVNRKRARKRLDFGQLECTAKLGVGVTPYIFQYISNYYSMRLWGPTGVL